MTPYCVIFYQQVELNYILFGIFLHTSLKSHVNLPLIKIWRIRKYSVTN